ncbi:peptidylprolyl isomerase [Candidatus Woesearchaeota archaeon]|nr:peptidylprolyl isomerase [Candidatus Woesearchaeota archaeon]
MKAKSNSKKSKSSKEEEVKLKFSKKTILTIVIVALIILAVFLILKRPKVAEQGDTVTVDYTGMLEDSTIFDTTIEGVAKAAKIYHEDRQYEPITFVLGSQKYIPGFEDAIYGMKEGEKKTVTIPPSRAYGDYDPKKIGTVEREKVNGGNISAGQVLTSGTAFYRVIEVNETHIFLDMNHPLAGKTLVFEIRLIKVEK